MRLRDDIRNISLYRLVGLSAVIHLYVLFWLRPDLVVHGVTLVGIVWGSRHLTHAIDKDRGKHKNELDN